MGNQPTIISSFHFESNSSDEAFDSIIKCIRENTDRFLLISERRDEKQITAIFITPKCGWHDKIVLQIQDKDGGCSFRGVSKSTNILCGWCGPFRCCTQCITCYSDSGQNILHLRELASAVSNNYREELESKKGFSIYVKQE